MSELQNIGAHVSAVAADLTGHAQALYGIGQRLRQAASQAAAAARGAEDGGRGATSAATALHNAAQHCERAAQLMLSGKQAAELFVARHVGSAGGSGRDGSDGTFGGSGSGPNVPGSLSNGQLEFVQAEFATSAGSAFFVPADTSYRMAANDVPPYPGEYVLDLHGTTDSVMLVGDDGGIRALSATEFADVVRRTAWSGQPIRLFSCNTGSNLSGFAQQLSNELGVTVEAPTQPVWSVPGGGTPKVSESARRFDPVSGVWKVGPVIPETGRWKTFYPEL